MKVKIGPYRDWVGPYTISNAVFFWVDKRAMDWDDDYLKRWDAQACEKFGDWLNNRKWLVNFLSWIDKFKERKIEIRIDPYDTWSMDHTLALIIHPMLIQLKKMNHGFFSSDPEDAPHIGVETNDDTQDIYDSAYSLERYNFIMDEMIWTFEQLADTDSEYKFYNEEKSWDLEASKKHNERIANGLRLFGKYYRGLWD
jgi:hypothetical protein